MKKLIITLLVILLISTLLPYAPTIAQLLHVPHEDPATAASPINAWALLAYYAGHGGYEGILELVASGRYEDVDELVERMKVEIKTLREGMDETKQAKEHVDNMDVSNIRRDMEALKQKSKYIEGHIERIDVRPLVNMIQEVENKVERLKASSALIIE